MPVVGSDDISCGLMRQWNVFDRLDKPPLNHRPLGVAASSICPDRTCQAPVVMPGLRGEDQHEAIYRLFAS